MMSRNKLKLALLALILVLVVMMGISVYFYYKNQTVKTMSSNQKTTEKETNLLISQVGKLMFLPNDETPTIATVTDITKLKDQPFFKNAKNNDKVLIYTKAKIAVIYRPFENKIVNVGPVTVGDQPNQPPQAKIAILNGTTITGLAAKTQDDLLKAFPGANILLKDQTNSANYDKTIVVTLNPLASLAADNLAKFFKVTTSQFPTGETKPQGADIVIIVGKDYAANSSLTPSQSPSPTKK